MQKKENFIKIIKANEGIIFKITTIYTHNDEDQRDLYQEIVYQLWKSFDSFRKESKVSTWLYRIALNTSIKYLDREKGKGNQLSIDQVVINHIDEKNTTKEDQVRELYHQIGNLNVIEKGLILLFLEGKSYDEIAEITGFSNSNVGTRLNRIKKKLKTQMKK